MDWFERLTGLDPDKGTGSFEAMLAAVVGVVIILSRRKARTTAR
jgi:hypothetical protein